MAAGKQIPRKFLDDLYDRITGDEDARVCKDIPESACNHLPRNFFAYLVANLLGKIADEISSAKLVIPWMFVSLGVPAGFTGFLVPIRESGVLVPQLAVAAYVRKLPIRKGVWLLGAVLSSLGLFGMAFAALMLEGSSAGSVIVLMLVVYSLARGLCSVSAKDVLGKTVSKSRRGALMGWSAGLSGVGVLAVGLSMGSVGLEDSSLGVFAGLLTAGGVLWIIASVAFATIREAPGATEGGGNAARVALQQMRLLVEDKPFQQFVSARSLLLAIALLPPFYVIIAQQQAEGDLLGLGTLIVANGLAGILSAPFWGYLGDKSSRQVMAFAAAGAGLLGLFTYFALVAGWSWVTSEYGLAIVFFVLNVMHGGARLGRKVYLVDMANNENRAAYVAVSNSVIGIVMLVGGLAGLLSDWLGAAATVLILSFFSLYAAVYVRKLPEVSDPS